MSAVPSLHQLKPWFQGLLRPRVAALAAAGVTANQVTLGTALVSVVLGALLAASPGTTALFALVPAWMILRIAANTVDGMLAREHDQRTTLGAYLNELCDVVADSALYLPYALIPGVSAPLVVVVVVAGAIAELAGALGPSVGATRRFDGPMSKPDRAAVFGLLGAGVAVGAVGAQAIDRILGLVLVLLAVTVVNRVRAGLAEADAPPTA